MYICKKNLGNSHKMIPWLWSGFGNDGHLRKSITAMNSYDKQATSMKTNTYTQPKTFHSDQMLVPREACKPAGVQAGNQTCKQTKQTNRQQMLQSTNDLHIYIYISFVYIYIYVCLKCIYIHIHTLHTYIYMYTEKIYIYIYMYIYIYICKCIF